ncbi:transposase [Nocardia gamkensis]
MTVRPEGSTSVGDVRRRRYQEAGRAAAETGQGTKEQWISLVGPGWAAQPADQDRARDRVGSGDDRACRLRETRPSRGGKGNRRNGTRSNTVVTQIGPVEIDVPRGTSSRLEPKIVRKRLRRPRGSMRSCCR